MPEFMTVYENIRDMPDEERQKWIWDKIIYANPIKAIETLEQARAVAPESEVGQRIPELVEQLKAGVDSRLRLAARTAAGEAGFMDYLKQQVKKRSRLGIGLGIAAVYAPFGVHPLAVRLAQGESSSGSRRCGKCPRRRSGRAGHRRSGCSGRSTRG